MNVVTLQSQPISAVLPDVKQVEVRRGEGPRGSKAPMDLLDLLSEPAPAPAPAPAPYPSDPFGAPAPGRSP